MHKTKVVIILYLLSTFLYSAGNALAENSYSKGELVCSPKNFRCGLFIKSQENTCQIYATHSINNNLPSILKPQFMEVITVGKSTLYGSKEILKNVEIKTKKYLEKTQINSTSINVFATR